MELSHTTETTHLSQGIAFLQAAGLEVHSKLYMRALESKALAYDMLVSVPRPVDHTPILIAVDGLATQIMNLPVYGGLTERRQLMDTMRSLLAPFIPVRAAEQPSPEDVCGYPQETATAAE